MVLDASADVHSLASEERPSAFTFEGEQKVLPFVIDI
jgi:hypothetical protein